MTNDTNRNPESGTRTPKTGPRKNAARTATPFHSSPFSALRSPVSKPSPASGLRFPLSKTSASSLITTLLVLVVLSTIVVAFMQSMSVERNVARSVANIARSQAASAAAADQAMAWMRLLFSRYPDSAVSWGSITNGSLTSFNSLFFYRRESGQDVGTGPGATNQQIYVLPLASGARAQIATNFTGAGAFSNAPDTSNMINLNVTGSHFGTNGWIGSVPGRTPASMSAQWIYITDAAGKTNARFAYWIEDESFKLNVNLAGSTPRSSNSLGTNAAELSITSVLRDVSTSPDTAASNAVAIRSELPGRQFLSEAQIAHANPMPATDAFDRAKFSLSRHSSALNLSRGGAKRVNINSLVEDSTDATEIREQLDRIVATITNSTAMPRFGQRFYRTGSFGAGYDDPNMVSPVNEAIYLDKVAANIRDFIDSDSQPTIVLTNGSVRIGSKPNVAVGFDVPASTEDEHETAAIGKEAVPLLQEYAVRIRLITFAPQRTSQGPAANYEFFFDHYFEFYNPTTKDIELADLGPNPFIRVYNNYGMDVGGGSPTIPPGRPLEVRLDQFVNGTGQGIRFPAGSYTVITTDGTPAAELVQNVSSVFRPNAAALADLNTPVNQKRRYAGTTTRASGGDYRVQPLLGTASGRAGTASSDYDTHVVVGNDLGLIESFSALPVPFAISINNDTGNRIDTVNFFPRGGSLAGNLGSGAPDSVTGDPRGLNEQLRIVRYSSSYQPENTRFLSSGLNNSAVPASSTIGSANANFVNPNLWPDYSVHASTNVGNSPYVAPDVPLRSIGEVGRVYDPARRPGNDFRLARGGGRTFRIGQSDAYVGTPNDPRYFGLWTGGETNASRNWTSWRLADVFSVDGSLEKDGAININGALRDEGRALRAALEGFIFRAVTNGGGPSVAGRPLNASNFIRDLTNQISTNLSAVSQQRPMWERGQISEIPSLSLGTALSGVNMGSIIDRGREEIFERLVELITTRGNVFGVYCIGQSLDVSATGQIRPRSTAYRKVVFKLTPQYDVPLPADSSFDPAATSGSPDDRFRRPDRFLVQVLDEKSL